jgi:hypothetical protein
MQEGSFLCLRRKMIFVSYNGNVCWHSPSQKQIARESAVFIPSNEPSECDGCDSTGLT